MGDQIFIQPEYEYLFVCQEKCLSIKAKRTRIEHLIQLALVILQHSHVQKIFIVLLMVVQNIAPDKMCRYKTI